MSDTLRALAVLALCLPAALPARAEGHGDCPVHEVRPGDTLSILADLYYGDLEAFSAIYDANLDVIGPDPNRIELGMPLTLPCSGAFAERLIPEAVAALKAAMMADTPAEAEAEGEAEPDMAEAPAAMPPKPGIPILTGGPFAPFVGEDLPGGGLFTELITAALDSTDGDPAEIVMVNDRASHLWDLMPRGGFAATGPWFYPDCSAEPLTPEAGRICADFRATTGYYEFVTEFYARADTEWASIVLPGGLTGTRICMPAGYPTAALDRFDLPTGAATLIRGDTPADCLLRLDRREVEVAAIEAAVTRALIDHVPVENPIVVLESLSHVDRLRILVPRNAADADALLARFDAALTDMSTNGIWFEIVTRHLRSPANPA